jgi:hypothetical protein
MQEGIGIIDGYDIRKYATDPTHEERIAGMVAYIKRRLGPHPSDEKITKHIRYRAFKSEITGNMISSASTATNVPYYLIMALIQNDSMYGTKGIGAKTKNPGNVGNDDAGHKAYFDTWKDGVMAVAAWLKKHKIKKQKRKICGNTTTIKVQGC